MKGIVPLIFSLCLAVTQMAKAAEMRLFKDTTGRTLEATFLSANGDNISLMLKSGTTAIVNISKLSKPDQEYVASQQKATAAAYEAINKALGFPAFSHQKLIARPAAEVAKAMKLPMESDAPIGKSWRLYAAARVPGYKLFSTTPYSVALYSSAAGNAQSLSIVFANKGDYGSTVGFGRDHFTETGKAKESISLASAMTHDTEQISKALTTALGQPTKQRYGDSGTRRSVSRWDWNDHAFLLSHVENEYVSLLVVPSNRADGGGRSEMVRDAEVRTRLQASVKRTDTGDVTINGIPMVDQGPKGYCVPATFERAMRFMGIESDMYLLAMVGETMAGGGTSVERLMENLRSQVYSKGRRLKESKIKELRIRDVKREIDSGIPIIWRMCSTEFYNEAADENTAKRGKDGHTEWLNELRKETAERENPEQDHHVCMIIGYNEATAELAVSDSWGEEFELRWVPLEVAALANNGALVMIQP